MGSKPPFERAAAAYSVNRLRRGGIGRTSTSISVSACDCAGFDRDGPGLLTGVGNGARVETRLDLNIEINWALFNGILTTLLGVVEAKTATLLAEAGFPNTIMDVTIVESSLEGGTGNVRRDTNLRCRNPRREVPSSAPPGLAHDR